MAVVEDYKIQYESNLYNEVEFDEDGITFINGAMADETDRLIALHKTLREAGEINAN